MDSDERETRIMLLGYCITSIIVAIAWPFIYPGLDYLMALIHFSGSPGLLKAINEFGPIYGKSTTAPGFFRGMAEATQQLTGEAPALASLPYMAKAALLMYISVPVYLVEVVLFVIVAFLSLLSRLLPWQGVKTVVQVAAVIVSLLPLLAILLWCVVFVGIAYVQAWSSSPLDFVFLILLFPAVLIRVVSPLVGVTVLARWFVPSSLALGGTMGREALESIFV